MIRKRFSLPALGLALLVAVLSGTPPGSGRAAAQAPAAPAPGEALGVTLAFPGSPTSTIRGEESAGRFLFSANEVTAALSGTLTFDAATDSYEIKLRGHSAVFGVESAVVVIDTRLVQLIHPVKGEGSTAMVDLEFLAKVVAPLAGVTFTFDRSTRTLAALRSESAEIGVEATIGAADTTTKVVFRFSAAPTFRVEKGDDQIVLRITGARLVPSTAEKVPDDPRVARILLRPTELAVVLKEKNLSSNVYALQNPARIVVDVSKVTALPVETPAAVPGAPTSVPPPAAVPAIDPRVIVLDAGHGGSEEGAKGPTGLLEKEATLALVRALSRVLTAKGYRVVATRDSDVTVGLEDRAAAANSAKADLFISVHCNASRAPAAHGTEVYYLSLDASDRAAEALAENENRTDPTPTPSAEANAALREVDLILWDLAQNQHLAASSRLAEIIQGDFNRLLGITTRGVKQAPFKVLIGVNAPAVLVEVAFITNPDEEKKLRSEEFHAQVAETLLGSLSTYFGKADGTAPVPSNYVAPTPAIGTKR